MKKEYLRNGICFALLGLCLALAAGLTETFFEGLLWGLAGGMGVPGLCMIIRYYYWSAPGRREAYEERLDLADIEKKDELKEKLRDRSGRYAYNAGLLVICAAMVVISFLGKAGVLEGARFMVFFLFGYLVFQFVLGVLIFNALLKEYE